MSLLPRKGVLAITAVIDVALNARNGPVSAEVAGSRHRLIIRCLSIEVEPSKHLVDKAIGQPTAGAPAAGKTNRLIRAKEPSRKKEKPSPVAPGLGL